MSRASLLLVAIAATLLTNCSSSAPQAPIGLDKRPANSPETIAGLLGRGGALAGETLKTSSATPEPTALARSTPVEGTPGAVFVISDYSAPRGLESLSLEERTRLVTAARSARSVTILCRGDRVRPSQDSRTAMLRRGVKVKRFLIAQGVDPQKVRLFLRSTGAFVADNGTLVGRAKNRRVEIRLA